MDEKTESPTHEWGNDHTPPNSNYYGAQITPNEGDQDVTIEISIRLGLVIGVDELEKIKRKTDVIKKTTAGIAPLRRLDLLQGLGFVDSATMPMINVIDPSSLQKPEAPIVVTEKEIQHMERIL